MDNKIFSTNRDADGWEKKQELLEQGRQLHNQAIQQTCIAAVRGLARCLKKGFGNSSKEHDFESFYGEIPAKK